MQDSQEVNVTIYFMIAGRGRCWLTLVPMLLERRNIIIKLFLESRCQLRLKNIYQGYLPLWQPYSQRLFPLFSCSTPQHWPMMLCKWWRRRSATFTNSASTSPGGPTTVTAWPIQLFPGLREWRLNGHWNRWHVGHTHILKSVSQQQIFSSEMQKHQQKQKVLHRFIRLVFMIQAAARRDMHSYSLGKKSNYLSSKLLGKIIFTPAENWSLTAKVKPKWILFLLLSRFFGSNYSFWTSKVSIWEDRLTIR